ncbi:MULTISPECIES: CoA transferase [Rhodopseudomonas]|uniref:Carnitine dehydratase n=1 Tax=Rhodopseudomonas palustris TaxID=1076 RepID=A0A0D7EHU1_RHOPL|nr:MULTISPECIES: CoA transferase [Rhodopseudomonas]KIZ40394.1 carnitine dehydratase [Rhodopseudomonas palustris]MDF3813708.1 CoA transferase [Rhodopseudomonas sp. BAL398]WOK17596.1 CoA transferase [Rhodopseudomonas sp. BAL398]
MLDRIVAEFPEHTPRLPAAPTALGGVRVVDFSHFIAGPFATTILADMGADVIKIEAPGRGDDLRRYPPVHPELAHGAPFQWTNRNKRSVALDLKSPSGVAIARELIATADVVVENFSTGVMARFGLDYDGCRQIKPDIVYCSVSAYGRSGPFADRLGFDPIAQVESGFVSMNGYADRAGVRALSPVMDISTAMMACNAILGALVARQRTGEGQAIEVSLFDTAVTMTGYASMQQLFSGADPQRNGNTSPDTCPSGVFQASDCAFYINCGNDKIFQRLMGQVIGRPDLAQATDYATGPDRVRRRDELFAILGDAFAQQPWAHWQARMRAAGVPHGQLRSVGEAIRSPEARDRGLVTRIRHDGVGWVPNVASPIRYSGTPLVDPVSAPTVGQHTETVLRELLGYDDAGLAEHAAAGAFGAEAPPASPQATRR